MNPGRGKAALARTRPAHTMTGMRIHHLALRVADLERARAFYGDVLGLTESRRFEHPDGSPRSIWFEAGDALLMLETRLAGSGAEQGSGHLLAFAIDDRERWAERLAQAGVPVLERSAHTLYVRDPDGHRVGLSSYPTAG